MHKTSGRWKVGLALSLTTATLWGMLPIALKGLLDTIDSTTITWYRFSVSLLLVTILLFRRNRIPNLNFLKNKKQLLLFSMVIFGLSGNYILYVMGLNLVTPSAAQIVIQVAPLLLLLGGIIVFKEVFSGLQWFGVVIFISGLLLFFNHRINSILTADSEYSLGLLFVFIAAFSWAAYALAQKQLLLHYGSQQILMITYVIATLLFLPGAEILSVAKLDSIQWWLLVFCCINTLFAYGCFAEALEHWEASRVGAVLAITPLMTMLFALLTQHFYPNYIVLEDFNSLSFIGAGVLVVGSLVTALAKRKTIDIKN